MTILSTSSGNGRCNAFASSFESGQDLLDLTAFGFASVQDIQTTFNYAGDLQIQFADGGTVTLIGVTQLQLEHDILI